MSIFKRTLQVIIILVIILIVGSYFILSSRFGAHYVSVLLSQATGYNITIDKVNLAFTESPQIRFQNIKILDKHSSQTQPYLIANSGELQFEFHLFNTPGFYRIKKIKLQDGEFIIPHHFFSAIRADFLELHNMKLVNQTFHVQNNDYLTQAEGINVAISPWFPTANQPLGKQAQLKATVDSLTINHEFTANNLIIMGFVRQGLLDLKTIGADFGRGQLVGKIEQLTDNSWQVDELKISQLRYQSPLSLTELVQHSKMLPAMTIKQLEILDSSLEGKDWSINNFNSKLTHLKLDGQGHWTSTNGIFNLSAENIMLNNEDFISPIITLKLNNKEILLSQLMTQWQKGIIQTSGVWSKESQSLMLNKLMVSGVLYSLPEHWLTLLTKPHYLPDWLKNISIQQLLLNNNLLIEPNQPFPFQLTGLNIKGENLILLNNQQWGLWQGNLSLEANDATFNKVDLRYLTLMANADMKQVTIPESSAFIQNGLMEMHGSMSLLNEQPFTITLKAKNIPTNTLKQWGWESAIMADQATLELILNGDRNNPLKSIKQTLQGSLKVISSNNQQQQEKMKNGVISLLSPNDTLKTEPSVTHDDTPLPLNVNAGSVVSSSQLPTTVIQ